MRNEPLTMESVPGRSGSSRILRLTGPITTINLSPFQEELRKDPPQTWILDLSGVPYMDSAGIGAVISCYVSCLKGGRKIIIAAPNVRVIELFRITKVDILIPIVASVEEAEAL
jgi:anti-anti-sigma factor